MSLFSFISFLFKSLMSPEFVGRFLKETALPLVAIQDTETHLHRRKSWTRGTSPAAIKEYEPLISRRILQLLEKLESQKGELILGTWINDWSYVFSAKRRVCATEADMTPQV